MAENPFKHEYVQEKDFWVPKGWNSFVVPKYMHTRRKIIDVSIEEREVHSEILEMLVKRSSMSVGDRHWMEIRGFVREIDGKEVTIEDLHIYKQLL
jgi:hypothetical protein